MHWVLFITISLWAQNGVTEDVQINLPYKTQQECVSDLSQIARSKRLQKGIVRKGNVLGPGVGKVQYHLRMKCAEQTDD